MGEETNRLNSFGSHWPHNDNLSEQRMAKAGFYYCGHGDKVACPFCNEFFECWNPEDNPFREHQLLSKGRCPYIENQQTSCKGDRDFEPMDDSADHTLDAAPPKPIVEITRASEADQPVVRSQANLMSRLQSFRTWPKECAKQPDELFPAGFFYTGAGDRVRCYSCGGELNRWNPGDLPWVEHARYHPECVFLRANKTQFFIDQATGNPAVRETKRQLREYAHSRGFKDVDINQILQRPEPYETEKGMLNAIVSLENDDYQNGSTAVDDYNGQGKLCQINIMFPLTHNCLIMALHLSHICVFKNQHKI